MKNLVRISLILLIVSLLSILSIKAQTGTGSIRGNITDENGLPLVGATIFIEELTHGTIADVNGNYQLLGVPVGKQTVTISFIGYATIEKEIEMSRGDVYLLNQQMGISTAEIVEVTAYGQARGQNAAIQQQLNASGISNVVSAEKLRELPDENVAEAIGRLPGLMVERDRGEGQKIIIRGLAPKYNTISIGGNIIPSTSPDDRSTDLNMISPDIIGGVEVHKATTADMDASGLGGTVNLILKEAPSGFRMNVGLLTGYNSLSKSIGNYRANFDLSNRFFNDKLGVMLSGNVDLSDRDADRLGVNYEVQGDPDYAAGETFVKPWIADIDLESNTEERTRVGGSLLLDWQIGSSTTIKTSSFVGYLKQETYDLTKNYDFDNNLIDYEIDDRDQNQLLYSNSIEGRHFILGSIMNYLAAS